MGRNPARGRLVEAVRALVGYSRASRLVRDPTPWKTRAFDKQREFLDSPARRKCAKCTRRAGKSVLDAIGAIDAISVRPDLLVPYITKTSKTSKDILWNELSRMNHMFNLGLKPDTQGGRFWTKDGGAIWLAGCKDKSEAAEKFRGQKYYRVIVDEAGTFPSDVLEYLINDVLEPALSDYDGDLWLTGTPSVLPRGYFWARTTGEDESIKMWPTFHWSVVDNPFHILSKPGALEAKRIELGFHPDDPTWRREYLGEWATDLSKLVYRYDQNKNSWDGVLPQGKVHRVLSVDLGFVGDTSFTIGSSVSGFSEVYIEESYGMPGLYTSDIAAEVYRIRQRYPTISEMVIDYGGLGVGTMSELNNVYSLPFQKAQKTDKASSIRQVQDRLRMGKLKLHPRKCSELIAEWDVLPWNDDHDDHDKNYTDHRSDGILYNVRQHPLFDTWQETQAEMGTDEWGRAQAEAMRIRAMRRTSTRSR